MFILQAAIAAFIASLAYAMVFELRGKTLFLTSLGGAISWVGYKLILLIPDVHYLLPFLIGTILSSIYAEVMARLLKKPATVFLIVAMLPLVPGQGIYETMVAFVTGNNSLGARIGGQTLAITATLAIGMLMTSTIFRLVMKLNRHVSQWEHSKKSR